METHDSRASRPFHIPEIFCWTKVGTEAGQSLKEILQRKEMERRVGGGTFAWGIGNPLGEAPELAKKLSTSGELDILFTRMKSAPRQVDASPSTLFLWMFYQKSNGEIALLPDHMLVTSRGYEGKRVHYALLCKSESELKEDSIDSGFDATDVRNLISMNPVGASQVTSVVRYMGRTTNDNPYRIAFSAKLYAEGFVKLVEPVPITDQLARDFFKLCTTNSVEAWRTSIRLLKESAMDLTDQVGFQSDLAFA